MHWGNTSQDGYIQLTQYTKKELVLPAWAAFLEEHGGAGIDKKVLKKKFCLEKRPEKIVNDVMAHACKEDWTFMISTGKIGVYRDATNKEIEFHLCRKVKGMLSGKVFSVQDGNTKNAASSIENSQQQNTNASHNRATVDAVAALPPQPKTIAASIPSDSSLSETDVPEMQIPWILEDERTREFLMNLHNIPLMLSVCCKDIKMQIAVMEDVVKLAEGITNDSWYLCEDLDDKIAQFGRLKTHEARLEYASELHQCVKENISRMEYASELHQCVKENISRMESAHSEESVPDAMAASSIENSQQQNTNASHNRATVDTAHSEESVPDAMAASSIGNSQQQNTNASHNRATVVTAHSEESVPDAMAASSIENSQQQNTNASQNKATVDTAHSEESVQDAMAGVATTDLGSDNNDNDGYRRVPSENDKVGMDCTSRSQKRPNNTQQQGRDDGSKISCLESIMERVACMESIMEHDSTSRKRCKRFSGKPSSWTHEAKGEGEPAETTFEMVPAQHDAAGAGVPAQPFRLWYECLQCHSFQEITTHHPMDRCYQDGSRDNSGETWKCHGFCKDFTYI